MEHQVLPRGVSSTHEDRVPYIGNKDYLDVPFLDYPSRAGYEFLIRSPTTYVDQALLMKKPPSVDFLQTWLFFGWLHEVLGSFVKEITGTGLYKHEDFLQTINTPAPLESSTHDLRGTDPNSLGRSTDDFITTAKLNELLEKWRHIIEPEVTRLESQFIRLWTSICIFERVLSYLPSEPPVNHMLSMCSTIEAVELCINDVFSDQPYARNCRSPLLNHVWKEDRVQRMKDIGWCPYDALQLIQKSQLLQVALYIERLNKQKHPLHIGRHQKCNTSECRKDLPPPGSHHRRLECDCSEVRIDKAQKHDISSMLRLDTVPLLSLNRTNDVVSVSVVPGSRGTKYTALSHIWADGLGNDQANALRQCQLLYIYDQLEALNSPSGNQNQEHLVWIDTMCVPKEPREKEMRNKAITLMQGTYEKAEKVLVLDAELEATNHTDLDFLEIFARVICSGWMRRLWTLQEAFLAQTLWIQFRDEAINIDHMMKEHDEPDRRISTRWLYDFLKTSYFGIRTSRAMDPLNPQFSIHSLAMTAPGRLTKNYEDEPTCLSTLLGLPLESLFSVPEEERMLQFWRLLSESPTKIPDYIIFEQCPRLSQEGFRWAPSSILKSKILEVAISSESRGVKIRSQSEVRSQGLHTEFPGIQL